jgi:hypothetical protein
MYVYWNVSLTLRVPLRNIFFCLVMLSGYYMYFVNIYGMKWINSSRNKREAYGSDIPVCVRACAHLFILYYDCSANQSPSFHETEYVCEHVWPFMYVELVCPFLWNWVLCLRARACVCPLARWDFSFRVKLWELKCFRSMLMPPVINSVCWLCINMSSNAISSIKCIDS